MNLRFTCLELSISLSTWLHADKLEIAVLPAHEDLFEILQDTSAGENDPFAPKENQTNLSSPRHPKAIAASLGDGPIYDFKSQFVGEIGHDITVLERPTANDSDKFDRLILRIDPKPTEYQRRFDKEWQRETARKIAAEIGIVAE